MTKRAYLLLAVFVMLVILAGFFITAYRLYWDETIKNYVLNLSTCGLLSESSCQANPKCETIYRQENTAKNALDFEKCQVISDYKKKQMALAQQLCQQTNGSWQKLTSGYYCNCVSSGELKVWDKDRGCQLKKD